MDLIEIKALIRQELPAILKTDETFRYILQGILQDSFADKQKTEDRIEQILVEMRKDRERNQAEMLAMREESNAKWNKQQAEIKAMREESERKWNEQRIEFERKWAESNAKWDKQQAEIQNLREETKQIREETKQIREESQQILKEVQYFIRKYESNIGALGSRWGLHSESAFRNALKSILEESFGVKVLNINEFDNNGEVFGQPDQVELDIIIKNGLLIVCEIKSSISKNDMYIFERKVRYYEKHHQQTANRMIVISPMVDKYAYPVAKKLGIEVHSHAEEVEI